MTVAEANSLYEKITGQILGNSLREAFSNLTYLIQQNGFGLAYDQLNELESNYRYLLRFRLEGYADPNREKIYSDLRRKALELTDEAWTLWMSMRSPQMYYELVRSSRTDNSPDVESLIEELGKTGEKLTLVELASEKESREVQAAQLNEFREKTARTIFQKIWISGDWGIKELAFYRDTFNDISIMEYEKALFVSAIFLSLLQRFDEEKILLLIELCSNFEPEVSQRAVVATSVILYIYDRRLPFYPSIGNKIDSVMESDDLKKSFVRVFYQLVRSKDTENVTKKMQEEILPEMTRFGSVIQDKLRQEESEDASDEFNPDWKNMIEDAGFSVKMQEFSDMQLEGIDVYMSTFSGQKFYPFFNEAANWFLPFYKEHSSLSSLFENKPKEGMSILDAVLKSGFLCSSDKYSFCFNVLQIPSKYRDTMATSLGADTEVYDEYSKSETSMNPAFQKEQISNRYIQDLYRFFNLFGKKRDFRNIFSLVLDLQNTVIFGRSLNTEDTLKKIGQLYFKNKNYSQALQIIDTLLETSEIDAELLQRKGYCLQQLDRREEALDAYLQADLVQPDSLWTLKRIAACYRFEKNPDKAMEYYKKAEKLAPDNVILLFNIGHTLVDAGKYSEALNLYFKAELLSEESLKTWRPIAWCSMMCGKYEQAGKYYEKIMNHNPGIDDYLNAGHLEWCKGSPLKAIDIYKLGIRSMHITYMEFLELFKKDFKVLKSLGIPEDEIPFVRDELFYSIQEQ